MIAYLNGKIYTAEPQNLWSEAVIVKENKIEFVGSTEEAKKKLNDKDEIIDLDGKLMLPGFIDSHLHLMIGGFQLINIDMDKVRSKNEFREEIKKYTSENNLKWVTGGNWDHERFKEKTLPTKEWIDDITPDIPVFVTRRDLHMGLANSKALELAGIDKNTPNPEGGLIMKNSNGDLTGILKDTAMNFINKIIPEFTEEEDYKALDAALAEFKKLGITSVHDISRKNDFSLYKNYLTNDKLTCRIYSIYPIGEVEKSNNFLQYEDEKLKTGCIKAFSDGSLGSATAWFFEPYTDEPGNAGLPTDSYANGELRRLALKFDKEKHQMAIHAIGEK
jgi:predicted amidohydrolase YtcJ